MTLPDRSKRFALSDPPPSAERPKIWIDGRQRRRFNLRAYAATSLGMARRDLPPEILDAEGRLRRFGDRLATGEFRPGLAWTGRLQRAVPSPQRVGGWLLGLADLLGGARVLLGPEADKDVEPAYPNLVRGRVGPVLVGPEPVGPEPVGPEPGADIPAAQGAKSAGEPTLQAIRSAIRTARRDRGPDAGESGPVACVVARPAGPVRASGLVAFLRRSLWAASCRVVLLILMAFAVPGAAVKALLYHLNGGDLADWS